MSYLDRAKEIAKSTKALRVVRFFPESDLRAGHVGLRKLAMKANLDPHTLKPGEFLVFANRALTRLKIFAPGNVIAYLASPDEKRLDLDVIRYIPRYFHGGQITYDDLLLKNLSVKMKKAA